MKKLYILLSLLLSISKFNCDKIVITTSIADYKYGLGKTYVVKDVNGYCVAGPESDELSKDIELVHEEFTKEEYENLSPFASRILKKYIFVFGALPISLNVFSYVRKPEQIAAIQSPEPRLAVPKTLMIRRTLRREKGMHTIAKDILFPGDAAYLPR
ncbi:hypothetical protein KAW80_03630 [Candidatus Babeliales bacterium]|nr:hypothetical protein [Candidatus Babeliales bacterium]